MRIIQLKIGIALVMNLFITKNNAIDTSNIV